jgi:hypothetical protein
VPTQNPIPLTGRGRRGAVDGPRLTSVTPVLSGNSLTALILNFNEPLNAGRATNLATYQVRLPGRGLRFTGASSQIVPIGSAAYDPSSSRVTLTFSTPTTIATKLQLRVHGKPKGGLTDSWGHYLDGRANGRQGSDVIAVLGPFA